MQTLYGSITLTLHLELSPCRKKIIRIINNHPRNCHSSLLFEKIVFLNQVSKSIINLYHQYLKIGLSFVLKFTIMIHLHDTSSADKLFKPSYRTDSYGKISLL